MPTIMKAVKKKKKKPLATEVRTVDAKARVSLPKSFAGATVTCDLISESEIVIRKAVVIPEADLPMIEDSLKPLSDRDRDFFIHLLENPPEPNAALRAALKDYKRWHARQSD